MVCLDVWHKHNSIPLGPSLAFISIYQRRLWLNLSVPVKRFYSVGHTYTPQSSSKRLKFTNTIRNLLLLRDSQDVFDQELEFNKLPRLVLTNVLFKLNYLLRYPSYLDIPTSFAYVLPRYTYCLDVPPHTQGGGAMKLTVE